MRLPKNPSQFEADKTLSPEDFNKVIKSILEKQYRTVQKVERPQYSFRLIRLPDGSLFLIDVIPQFLLVDGRRTKKTKLVFVKKAVYDLYGVKIIS